MMKDEIINIFKESLKTGIVGIGVSIMFFFSYSAMINGEDIFFTFLIYIIFGYIVGTMIPFTINLFYNIFFKVFPIFKSYIVLELLVAFIFGSAVFYLCMYLFSTLLNIFVFDDITYMLYISLGIGVATVMIQLYYVHLEQKVELEKENKQLAVIEERNRIARELHDSVSQNLFGISLNLNTLPAIMENDIQRAITMTEQLQDMVQEVQTEMRLMIYELRPLNFREKEFFESIDSLIGLYNRRYKIDIEYELQGDEDGLEEKIQLVLYRVLQESLNNIVKHADADIIKISMHLDCNSVELNVEDNGVGFDTSKTIGNSHCGIKGMRERLEEVGGVLKIDSLIGEGTKINVEI